MSDLAFHTTDELIKEILSRQTFCGIIIKTDNEYTIAGSQTNFEPGGLKVGVANIPPDVFQNIMRSLADSLDNAPNDSEESGDSGESGEPPIFQPDW